MENTYRINEEPEIHRNDKISDNPQIMNDIDSLIDNILEIPHPIYPDWMDSLSETSINFLLNTSNRYLQKFCCWYCNKQPVDFLIFHKFTSFENKRLYFVDIDQPKLCCSKCHSEMVGIEFLHLGYLEDQKFFDLLKAISTIIELSEVEID